MKRMQRQRENEQVGREEAGTAESVEINKMRPKTTRSPGVAATGTNRTTNQ